MIRSMTDTDLPEVTDLVMKSFMASVADGLSQQGIDTFTAIASETAFAERLEGDNAILVYTEGRRLKGVAELKQGRHVAMLFVAPDAQRQGIGRALLDGLLEHAREEVLTVSASLPSVPAYHSYGFSLAGEPDETSGLRFQPMTLQLGRN